MRIQRPIIVRDNHNLYSDVLQMTQAHQHAYECVLPLQGHISFTDTERDGDTKYRNTFSLKERPKGTQKGLGDDVDNLVLLAVLALIVTGVILCCFLNTQYAFNPVTLTQFGNITTVNEITTPYALMYAGDTKPLHCLIIALSLLSCSLVVGWQSKRHEYVRKWWISFVALLGVVVLQVLSVILHCVMYPGGKDAQDFAKVFMLTNTSMLVLHFATAIITCLILGFYAFQPVEPPNKELAETQGNFWLCVVEDLNMIVFYAFVFRAFSSQISVHDDTATFFDVLCVVVIGFLQHVANILMIFHAHIKIGKDVTMRPMNPLLDTSTVISSTDKIIKSIARTRALIFFMIAVVTVFLYLRIAPTCEEFPVGIPYELLRSLALVSMISLNTLHSLSFEMQGSITDKPWDTSPTWKLLTTGLISVMVAAFLLATVLTHRDKDAPSMARHEYLLDLVVGS